MRKRPDTGALPNSNSIRSPRRRSRAAPGGTSIPSARAVWRLMTNSNLQRSGATCGPRDDVGSDCAHCQSHSNSCWGLRQRGPACPGYDCRDVARERWYCEGN